MALKSYKAPSNWGMLDLQRYANRQGWKIIRAVYNRGIRERKAPKNALEMDDWFSKSKAIASSWTLLYIPT